MRYPRRCPFRIRIGGTPLPLWDTVSDATKVFIIFDYLARCDFPTKRQSFSSPLSIPPRRSHCGSHSCITGSIQHKSGIGMAHRRHTPLTRHQSLRDIQPSPAALVRRRKYPTRSSPNSQRRALSLLHPSRRSASHTAVAAIGSDGDDDDEDNTDEQALAPTATDNRLRPVLAALHQNLRRLPSRLLLAAQSTATRHKRERNRDSSMRDIEPELAVPVGTKRKRIASSNENAVVARGSRSKRMKTYVLTIASEESKMEIDTPSTWTHSDDSDEDAEDDSCQCYCHTLFRNY